MPEPQAAHGDTETLLGGFRRITELRDVFIVAIFVVYFIGLVAWSINSFLNRTGFMDLLDVRYWIAGFLPAASVFCCAFGYYSIAMPQRISPSTRTLFNLVILISIILVCLHISVRWEILRKSELPTWRGEMWAYVFLMIIFLITLVAGNRIKTPSTLIITTAKALQGPSDRTKALRACFSVMGFASIFAYVAFIFPNIPQELGGGAPRCADVELQSHTLSLKIISEMGGINRMSVSNENFISDDMLTGSSAEPAGSAQNDSTIRLENFQVLYHSSDMVVGKFERPPERKGFSVVHLEVPRSSVNVIAWKEEVCENRAALVSYHR